MPTEIGSTTGAVIVGSPGVVTEVDIAAMGDEAILDMLRSRLRDVDGQIGNITRTLQQQTSQAQALGQEAQRLNALRGLVAREPHMETSTGNLRHDNMLSVADLRNFEDQLGLREGALGSEPMSLGRMLSSVVIGGRSMGDVGNREGLQLRADTLSEQIRECNSGNEQLMVRLQSNMQQRTQVVQLCTNMLKAADEARDAVVGNLR